MFLDLSFLSRDPPSRLSKVSGLRELIWSELVPAPGISVSGFNGAEEDSPGTRFSKMQDEKLPGVSVSLIPPEIIQEQASL